MDKAGLPKKPRKVSVPPPIDDIPVALRDTPSVSRRYRLKPIIIIGGLLGLGAIALLIGILFPKAEPQSNSNSTLSNSETQASPTPQPSSDTVLGHFPYQEASTAELQSVTADGRILMRKAAAKQFEEMARAARANGVILSAISGFRSIADQQHIFFDVKAQRGQAVSKRAEVSAPPGYSEHHTGYAADIGDGNVPAANLSPNFEKTAAFKWLQANAARYSFEMSFPRDNTQGVSYEPWHWRFVGDRESLETFYKAKNSGVGRPESGVQTPEPEVTK